MVLSEALYQNSLLAKSKFAFKILLNVLELICSNYYTVSKN